MDKSDFYEPDIPNDYEDPFLLENGRSPSPDPPESLAPDLPPKKRHSCWITGIALLVILSLVASALMSLVWVAEELTANWTPPWITPTPSLADAGRIAYIGEEGQLFTVQPDGTNERQLTADEFPYQFPAWAGQSNQLAVLGGGSIVSVTDADAPNPITLYEGGVQSPFYLYWSPDNSQISFLANSQRGIALRVVDADGSGEAHTRGVGSPFYWDWLDDSTQMLVHTGTSGAEARLGILPADGEGELENIAPPGAFQAPGVSANGRYWAYAEDMGNGNSWLVISDTENGEQ
jgi:Tol biopolymer transport system component